MERIRVLLADDHSLFREGMCSILNAQPDFEVVGEAADGLEAMVKAREMMPNLVLMDINMPGVDGLEATRRIKQELQSVTIVMLTVRDEDEKLFQAIKSGAQGYVLKNIRSWELVNLLRGAMQGEAAITPAMAGRMLDEFRRMSQRPVRRPTGDDTVVLTVREQDVLSLAAACATDKEIADELCISIHTVKSHMRNILSKLQLGRRHEAALFAMREGLISPPDSDSRKIN